jgi:hypothetical protein
VAPVRREAETHRSSNLHGDDLLLTLAVVRSEAGTRVPSVMPGVWHPAQSGDQVGMMLGPAWRPFSF